MRGEWPRGRRDPLAGGGGGRPEESGGTYSRRLHLSRLVALAEELQDLTPCNAYPKTEEFDLLGDEDRVVSCRDRGRSLVCAAGEGLGQYLSRQTLVRSR